MITKRTTIWITFLLLTMIAVLFHTLQIQAALVDSFEYQLLLDIRLPRTISALAVGALLALCGLTMQSLFRNPLAEPSLIGVSGGAALGASLGFYLGLSIFFVQLLAIILALAALILVSMLAHRQSSNQLILAGVAINALCGSLLSLLLTQSNNDNLRNTTFWLMGNLGHLSLQQAIFFVILLIVTWLILLPSARFLNQLLLGENHAYYAGYAVKPYFLSLLLIVATACALIVSQTGSIAFIALMAPHIARLIVGGNNRTLLIFSPLVGACLCLLADDISQNWLYPIELPIGIITSLLGVPFFLWLLRKERTQ